MKEHDLKDAILRCIESKPRTADEISSILGLDIITVLALIRELLGRGYLHIEANNSGFVYHLIPSGSYFLNDLGGFRKERKQATKDKRNAMITRAVSVSSLIISFILLVLRLFGK